MDIYLLVKKLALVLLCMIFSRWGMHILLMDRPETGRRWDNVFCFMAVVCGLAAALLK